MISRHRLAWVLSFGASGGQAGLALVSGVVLARFLGPEGRGIVFGIIFWPTLFAGVFNLSVFEAAARLIAGARAAPVQERQALERGLLGLQFAIALFATVMSVAAVAAVYGLAGQASEWHASAAILYTLILTPIALFDLHFRSVRQGRQEFVALSAIRLVTPLTFTFVVAGLALSGKLSEPSVMGAMLAATGASLIVNLIVDRGTLPARKPAIASKGVVMGLGFHGANLLVYAATEADKMVVLSTLSHELAGLFAVAVAVSGFAGALVMQSVTLQFFPGMASLGDDLYRQGQLVLRYFRRSILLLTALSAIVAALCPIVIPFVFGAEFVPAVLPAMLLTGAAALKAARQVIDRGLRGAGQIRIGIVGEVTTLATFLSAVFLLSGHLDLIGIALASVAAQAVSLTVLLVLTARRYGFSVGAFFGIGIGAWWRRPGSDEQESGIGRRDPN